MILKRAELLTANNKKEIMKTYCAACDDNVDSFVVYGYEVLPEKEQSHLKNEKFLKCPDCRNFVGTYTVKKNDLAPLGAIASKKMRKTQKYIRGKINDILEQKKDILDAKQKLYDWLTKKMFYEFRIECLISKDQSDKVLKLLQLINLKGENNV
ncbi:MAG: hypothetical protein ACJAW3_001336 [Lentimonas sp.]|jgi:hypothetical protein